MPAKFSARVPKYRLHKTWGLAVVRLAGRDIYLGKHGTPESQAEYKRVIGEWLASSQAPLPTPSPTAPACTVAELCLAYLRHASTYYVKNGKPTGEIACLRDAIKPLARLYSNTSAAEFGPLALKTVRQAMIDAGLSRGVVNSRVNRVRRVFKWGVENQLIPPVILEGLRAVAPLKFGRCEARETEPVKPVAEAVVETTKRAAPPTLAAMIELQQLSGMRPGELVIMRTGDLDMSRAVWTYTPSSHKTEHHGCSRVINLGPRAQTLLRSHLKDDPQEFIFSPRAVLEERHRLSRMKRRTPITPSERARTNKVRPKRAAGQRYTTMSYARAIAYACDTAFPHPELSALRQSNLTPHQRAELEAWRAAHGWSPNQLRHSKATAIRREFGLEAARTVLGHRSASTTEIYAERDAAKAAEVMTRVG